MKFFVVDLYTNGTIQTEHCDVENSNEYLKFINRYEMTHDIIAELTSFEVFHINKLVDDRGYTFNRTFITMPQD